MASLGVEEGFSEGHLQDLWANFLLLFDQSVQDYSISTCLWVDYYFNILSRSH